MYNKSVDLIVAMKKKNYSVIAKDPIEWTTADHLCPASRRDLRVFVRNNMTESPGKFEASKY